MTSRIAKNPVKIPSGVEVKLANDAILVKGKLGELKQAFGSEVKIAQVDGAVQVTAANETKKAHAMSGTMRALIQNMVTGVSEGFTKELVLIGVGYRAKVQGTGLDLSVGLSHPLVIQMPNGISVNCPTNTEIVLKGSDKQLLNQVAANIREVRPPEPYKGKGIRYRNEEVILKEGKKK